MTKWVFLAVYVFICAGFAVYALTCEYDWCGFMMLVPATPWIQLVSQLGLSRFSPVAVPLFYLLNAAIFYGAGAHIERLVRKIRSGSI